MVAPRCARSSAAPRHRFDERTWLPARRRWWQRFLGRRSSLPTGCPACGHDWSRPMTQVENAPSAAGRSSSKFERTHRDLPFDAVRRSPTCRVPSRLKAACVLRTRLGLRTLQLLPLPGPPTPTLECVAQKRGARRLRSLGCSLGRCPALRACFPLCVRCRRSGVGRGLRRHAWCGSGRFGVLGSRRERRDGGLGEGVPPASGPWAAAVVVRSVGSPTDQVRGSSARCAPFVAGWPPTTPRSGFFRRASSSW